MRIVQSTNIEAFKLTFEVLTGEFFVEVDAEDSEDEDWELCDLTQVEEDLEELDVELRVEDIFSSRPSFKTVIVPIQEHRNLETTPCQKGPDIQYEVDTIGGR